ncbi:hypothetical protein FB45DRAFT_788551 [Roridomyces roridus]|uniref:GATA-type domain-containing protein n=1 Tax=Roridomyces roridus TaxID=1738132 RepID=A0AAD7FPK8_9AGAR|nr:hypothetical protein FB45DRAFT_788551 [Roridomyces roridus]
MTAHSVLFNAIIDREPVAPRTVSPGLFSSRPSPTLRAATYWGEPEHGYSQYGTPSLPPLTRPSSSHSGSLSPRLDLNGLISMYESSQPNPVLDMPYDTEWSYPSSTYPRTKPPSTIWTQSPTSDDYPTQWNSILNGITDHSPTSTYSSSSASPYPSSSGTSSVSSSPTYFLSPSTTPPPVSHPSRNPTVTADANTGRPKKECFHCHVTSTPLWRREPTTQRPLCNACGLYLQQRNRLRPQELIDADIDDGEPEVPDELYTGTKCSHCGTRHTSVWRRNKEGAQVCNACGVYQRLRGKERPLSLRRNKIKPRTKHPR